MTAELLVLLEELEERVETLGGIGAHHGAEAAARDRREAIETLHKIAAATTAMLRYVEDHHECYRVTE